MQRGGMAVWTLPRFAVEMGESTKKRMSARLSGRLAIHNPHRLAQTTRDDLSIPSDAAAVPSTVLRVEDATRTQLARTHLLDRPPLSPQNLNYNTPGGKLNRGMSVVDTVEILKGRQLSEDEYFKAAVLGWCVELVSGNQYLSEGSSVVAVRCVRCCNCSPGPSSRRTSSSRTI
jgi:hypothetical protein